MIEYKVKVYNYGDTEWYLNGKLHKEDGPAYQEVDGYKSWWIDGKRHREDGPAIERANGDTEWYLQGKSYTKKDHDLKMNKIKELTLKEVEDLLGYEVKIVKGE